MYQILSHPADIIVEAKTENLPELFTDLARGMFEIITGSKVHQSSRDRRTTRTIEVTGLDQESLLVNFLNELLFLSQEYHEVYLGFDFKNFQTNKLKTEAYCLPLDRPKLEIKAAAQHNLKIKYDGLEYSTQVVFDI